MKSRCRGVTLVELVMVMVIAGILAATVLPRFVSRTDYDVPGYAESVRDVLRDAQKVAIAQHRSVVVNLDAAGGIVAPCFDAAYPCASPLPDPSSGGALLATAPAGVTLVPTAASLSFDWTGAPAATPPSVTIRGGSVAAIVVTVEPGTGYVH